MCTQMTWQSEHHPIPKRESLPARRNPNGESTHTSGRAADRCGVWGGSPRGGVRGRAPRRKLGIFCTFGALSQQI